MSIVLVTKQCYLVAERITYVSLEEAEPDTETKSLWSLLGKLYFKDARSRWLINISYTPVQSKTATPNHNSGYGSNREEMYSLELSVIDHKAAMGLYKEIVNEIREQSKDQLYLDQLVDKFLTQSEEEDAE